MSRKKVKLQWIANDAARRATFKKRRKGLMKKVQELSVLCDVKACAVIYGPYEPQPEVWPTAEAAVAMLRRFRSMPELEKTKKMMNQEEFLRQRISKVREQIRKEEKANREFETEIVMYQALDGKRSLQDLGIEDLTSLGCMVEMKIKEVRRRIEFLQGQPQTAAAAFQPSSSALQFHPPPPPQQQQQHSKQEEMNVYAATAAAGMFPELAAPPTMDAAAAEEMRRRDWIMEMMAPHDHLFYDGEVAGQQPFVDGAGAGANNPWMDPYFSFFN